MNQGLTSSSKQSASALLRRDMGRPGLAPGIYFRLLLVGYFEGIDSERGIAWRAAIAGDPFVPADRAGRDGAGSFHHLADAAVDGSGDPSRRYSHGFWRCWPSRSLLRGKTMGIDATTLEANAALRSIVRRDSGEALRGFLKRLAEEAGIETPTRAQLANWIGNGRRRDPTAMGHPHDPDARITKMKDGRTHLAHKAEHAVDMETGPMVAVTLQARQRRGHVDRPRDTDRSGGAACR